MRCGTVSVLDQLRQVKEKVPKQLCAPSAFGTIITSGANNLELKMVPNELNLSRLRRYVLDALADKHLASERFEDYVTDVRNGDAAPIRMLDFLSGLYAAGALTFEQDCDIDDLFRAAFPEF